VLGDELLHHIAAPLIVEDDDLHASLAEVRLAAEKGLVLADDDAGDSVEKACTGAFCFCSPVSMGDKAIFSLGRVDFVLAGKAKIERRMDGWGVCTYTYRMARVLYTWCFLGYICESYGYILTPGA
jgi:hypothetical protein